MFKTKKGKIILAVGAAVLVAAIAVILFFALKKPAPVIDTGAGKPILYIKNGALYSRSADGSGESIDISGNLGQSDVVETASTYMNLVKQSKNADITYFVKDYSRGKYRGSLHATTDYQTSFQVDNDIVVEFEYEYLKMSDDGKTIAYMKNLNVTESEVYADLYYKKTDSGDPVMIEAGLYGMNTQYLVSPNGEYIAGYSKYNPETQVGGLILLKCGEAPKKLALENNSSVSLKSLTNDGKLVYTANLTDAENTVIQSSIFIINHADMQTKTFGSNIRAEAVYISDSGSDKIVYADSNDAQTIYTYSASYDTEPVLITDKILAFRNLDVENGRYIYDSFNNEAEASLQNTKIYVKTPEHGEALVISEDASTVSSVQASADFNTIYYLTNSGGDSGELYITAIENGALTAPEKIADNVYNFFISKDGSAAVLITDYNTETGIMTLKSYSKANKQVKEIAAGSEIFDLKLSPDGLSAVYAADFNGDTAKLYRCELNSENANVTLISDAADLKFNTYDYYLQNVSETSVTVRDTYYVRNSNSVLYFKDIKDPNFRYGSLYLFKDGNNILIDTEATAVLFE